LKYNFIGLTAASLLVKRGLKVAAKSQADHFTDNYGSNHFSLAQCVNKCMQNIKTGIPVEMQAVFDYIKHF